MPVSPKILIPVAIFAAVMSASPAPVWRAPVESQYSKVAADFTLALKVAVSRSAVEEASARGKLAEGKAPLRH